MKESQYRDLVAQVEAQIADSSPHDREELRKHLYDLHKQALSSGICIEHPGVRAEQDVVDEAVEDQFDNMPV